MAIKFKRGTTGQKPSLENGEIYIDTTKKALTIKAGDEEFDAGVLKTTNVDTDVDITEDIVYRLNTTINQLEGINLPSIFDKQLIIMTSDYKIYKWIGSLNPAFDSDVFANNYKEL